MSCFFCGGNVKAEESFDHVKIAFCECEICGRYAFNLNNIPIIRKDYVASYLYHKNRLLAEERPFAYTTYIGTEDEFRFVRMGNPNFHLVTENEILAFYPNRFSDKIDSILIAISKKSKYFGKELYLSLMELKSLLFLTCFDEKGEKLDEYDIEEQLNRICEYLQDNNFVEIHHEGDNAYITMLSDGWNRVDERQLTGIENKDVFVSMSFSETNKPTREAIRAGIIKAGLSPEFMDEIIHNKQIVPEMFRLIRECRLLILDITDPNYGAYYEAGYAMGLGKEVIISCSKERYTYKYQSEDEKKYERYLKPHFDIVQKQLLIWDNTDDLTKKICEWIKALIR